MSGTAEAKHPVAVSSDVGALDECASVNRADRAELQRLDTIDLRTITPEEIQILAATGC